MAAFAIGPGSVTFPGVFLFFVKQILHVKIRFDDAFGMDPDPKVSERKKLVVLLVIVLLPGKCRVDTLCLYFQISGCNILLRLALLVLPRHQGRQSRAAQGSSSRQSII